MEEKTGFGSKIKGAFSNLKHTISGDKEKLKEKEIAREQKRNY